MVKYKVKKLKVNPSNPGSSSRLSFIQRFALAAGYTFEEYIENTKLSGIWLLNKRTNNTIRCIWSVILLLMVSFSVHLVMLLWESYYDHPVVTDLSDTLLISEIPFPTVTLCGDNSLEPKFVAQFISSLKIPQQFTKAEVRAALPLLANFNVFGALNLSINYAPLEDTLIYNNMSILAAARSIRYDCDDLAIHCYMNGQGFNCQQNELFAFESIETVLGSCCALQYKNKSLYHNSFGLASGLIVVGRYVSTEKQKNTISIYVHHPSDAIPILQRPIPMVPNSVTYIGVKPVAHSVSPELMQLPPMKRWCLTSKDFEANYYRFEHCNLACAQRLMIESCGCIPVALKNNDKVRIHPGCSLKDIECFSRNQENIIAVQCDACMPNCLDFKYTTSYSKMKRGHQLQNLFLDILKSDNATNMTNYYMARVYFDEQSAPHYKQVLSTPVIAVLSNLGGIVSVCVGITGVTFIEILYYIFYRLFKNLYKLNFSI